MKTLHEEQQKYSNNICCYGNRVLHFKRRCKNNNLNPELNKPDNHKCTQNYDVSQIIVKNKVQNTDIDKGSIGGSVHRYMSSVPLVSMYMTPKTINTVEELVLLCEIRCNLLNDMNDIEIYNYAEFDDYRYWE